MVETFLCLCSTGRRDTRDMVRFPNSHWILDGWMDGCDYCDFEASNGYLSRHICHRLIDSQCVLLTVQNGQIMISGHQAMDSSPLQDLNGYAVQVMLDCTSKAMSELINWLHDCHQLNANDRQGRYGEGSMDEKLLVEGNKNEATYN